MTWIEIKRASVSEAGVDDYEEIILIQCESGEGDQTFHKTRLGRALKLAENVSTKKTREDVEGCAVYVSLQEHQLNCEEMKWKNRSFALAVSLEFFYYFRAAVRFPSRTPNRPSLTYQLQTCLIKEKSTQN